MLLLIGAIGLWGCARNSSQSPPLNALSEAISPYLRQHADNPVLWQEWSDKALQQAADENKLLVISIGYASCHWCHVMEEETFMDSTAAAVMNTHFVALKIDREERPDIDQIYTKAAVLLNGSSGWPLNIIALPDGRPLAAVTYLPTDRWIQLLDRASQLYRDNPNALLEQANSIAEGVKKSEPLPLEGQGAEQNADDYLGFYSSLSPAFDPINGGLREEQKFPRVALWQALLEYGAYTQNPSALEAVERNLKAMASGGIYDHVGGGFARYTTDAQWHIPHFEKMLYDNAQLLSLYARAQRYYDEPVYEELIRQTSTFMTTHFRSPQGGYYASFNAVSEDGEGKYYTWTKADLEDLLDEEQQQVFFELYAVTEGGNWKDGENVIYQKNSREEAAISLGISQPRVKELMADAKKLLNKEREKRKAPSIDDKVITGWNAMMLKAFTEVYQSTGDEETMQQALDLAEFISENLQQDSGELSRVFHPDYGNSGQGFLDDYAHWIDALISLYQTSLDKKWLDLALKTSDYVLSNFSQEDSPMFTYSAISKQALYASDVPLYDADTPSPNALMAHNLSLLGTLYERKELLQKSRDMLAAMDFHAPAYATGIASWWQLLGAHSLGLNEVAILGSEAQTKLKSMQKSYLPFTLFLGGDTENLPLLQQKRVAGKTMIYVCRNKTCKLPVELPQQAVSQIRSENSPQLFK